MFEEKNIWMQVESMQSPEQSTSLFFVHQKESENRSMKYIIRACTEHAIDGFKDHFV